MNGFEIDNRSSLPSPAVLQCKVCGKEIRCIAYSQSVRIVCSSCGNMFNTEVGMLKTLKKYPLSSIVPHISIGTKGTFKGRTYAVTGFMQRRETEPYFWREYVLFSPLHGYAFLSEFNGHWNFIVPLGSVAPPKPEAYDRTLNYDNKEFRLYHRYKSSLDQAAGEFAWEIADAVEASEYISPPYILTYEKSGSELSWSLGEYMHPSDVGKAFALKTPVPERIGVGSNQPALGSVSLDSLKTLFIAAAVMLLAVQVIFSMVIQRNAVVLDQTYGLLDSSQAIVTPAFRLEGGWKDVAIELYSPVGNSWFEAGITLINDNTGEEFSFDNGVEYYSGYDGGESWSEGSTSSEKILSSIPEGTYHMNIIPYKPPSAVPPSFSIKVTRDIPTWRNLLAAIVLIGIYPAIVWLRYRSFERRRWMNSNYSPYETGEDE